MPASQVISMVSIEITLCAGVSSMCDLFLCEWMPFSPLIVVNQIQKRNAIEGHSKQVAIKQINHPNWNVFDLGESSPLV